MASNRKLSIQDYNDRLSHNLSFKYLNSSREKSPLKCLMCGHEDPNWAIYTRNASKSIKCPKCQNIPNRLEKVSAKLPPNLQYINYVNARTSATYKCNLCSNEGNILPGNASSNTKCKHCKNTGLTKIDRLNQKLKYNIMYVEYINSHELAKVRCLTCSHIWEITPKNITSRTRCEDCKNAIDEEKFRQFLQDNYLSADTIPKSRSAPHDFCCDLCFNVISKSVRDITKGIACADCNKYSDAKRCQAFADRNGIKFELQEPEHGEQYPSWTCGEGHYSSKLTLGEIKRRFYDNTRISWCNTCNSSREMMLKSLNGMAQKRGGTYLPGNSKQINFNHNQSYRCKEGHEFAAVPNRVRKNGIWCPKCDPNDEAILLKTESDDKGSEEQNQQKT